MRSSPVLFALVLACTLLPSADAARRRRAPRPPPGPKELVPTIGDSMDINAESDYLGKDWQIVNVLTPGSSVRRVVKRDGTVVGMRRRRGMVTWVKKRDRWPWENPWKDPTRAPFKVRYVRTDPRGVAASLIQEKKAVLGYGKLKSGREVVGFAMAKPRAWWKFWPEKSEEEE